MKNVNILLTISFLKGLYFYIPILTFFFLSKNIPIETVVIAQAIYSLFTFIGEIPTGILADKLGQKTSIVLGFMIEAIAIIYIVLFPTVVGVYGAFAIRGISSSFLSGSQESLLFDSLTKENKQNIFQKIYSQFLSNEQLGLILATFIAGLTLHFFGSQSFIPLIIATSVSMLIAGILAINLESSTVLPTTSTSQNNLSLIKNSFGLIFGNDTILNLTLVGCLTLCGKYFLQGVYAPYFQLSGINDFWIGASLSIGLLLNTLIMRYIYLIEKHFTLEKILLALNLFLGFGYILMSSSQNPYILVLIFVLLNGVFGLQQPMISDYINNHASSLIRSTVLSGISFFQRMFQLVITLVLGYIVHNFGVTNSLLAQGIYLITGIIVGYYLLVKCGCVYKVTKEKTTTL